MKIEKFNLLHLRNDVHFQFHTEFTATITQQSSRRCPMSEPGFTGLKRLPNCLEFAFIALHRTEFHTYNQRRYNMRNKLYKILAAGICLALALTFSCSSGDDGDGGGTSSPSVGGNISSSSNGGGGSCTGGTVKIDTKTWHKCNLNVMPSKGNSACYANNPENCDKYGRLYDWEAAKSVCPSGFHLPTTGEWNILVNYAGGESVAGEKLKAKSGWPGNGNGTDVFDFSALPGGGGRPDGTFTSVGDLGIWWSATQCNDSRACALAMAYTAPVLREDGYFASLFSVRCVQN